MRLIGFRLKFRMKLHRDKIWVVFKLDYFNQISLRIDTGKNHPPLPAKLGAGCQPGKDAH